jgi:hypothetical protein
MSAGAQAIDFEDGTDQFDLRSLDLAFADLTIWEEPERLAALIAEFARAVVHADTNTRMRA